MLALRLRCCVASWLCLFVLAATHPAVAEPRIALVITNQAYTQAGARLSNTHLDGELVKAALERVGFKVWVTRDTTDERGLLQAIAEHVRRLAEAGPDAVGFFYYSGHGAADRPNGENYLIPTNVPLTHASQLQLMAVQLNKITSTLASAGRMSFVVFDACRNVPLQRETKDLSFKGFAPVREQNGLLVAFATEPGNVAVDQSLYARALAEAIATPGLEAGQVFRRVRQRVRADTGQAQSPEYLDKRDQDFHFVAAASIAQPVPAPLRPTQPTAMVAPGPSPARCEGIEITVGQNERRCFKPGAGKSAHFKDCDTCPEMVVVPTGSFMMGSPKNEPERQVGEAQVRVSIAWPFAVGRFAVTFEEWDACVDDGGCNGYRPEDAGWGRGKRPVINVNWEDAKSYAAWLSRKTGVTYRLPSEAEREYVMRAGTTTPYWWGSSITPKQANYKPALKNSDQYRKRTLPVESFEPNPWGLYNVHGNVDEWTEDCWHENYQGAPIDGSAWTSECDSMQRVSRGGGWMAESKDLRSAAHTWAYSDRYKGRPKAQGFAKSRDKRSG